MHAGEREVERGGWRGEEESVHCGNLSLSISLTSLQREREREQTGARQRRSRSKRLKEGKPPKKAPASFFLGWPTMADEQRKNSRKNSPRLLEARHKLLEVLEALEVGEACLT